MSGSTAHTSERRSSPALRRLLDEAEELGVAGFDQLAIEARAAQATVLAREIVASDTIITFRPTSSTPRAQYFILNLEDDVHQRLGKGDVVHHVAKKFSKPRIQSAISRCRGRSGRARRRPPLVHELVGAGRRPS